MIHIADVDQIILTSDDAFAFATSRLPGCL